MENKKLVYFTKWILDFMFYSGCILCLSLPFLFKIAGRYIEVFKTYYVEMCILFFMSGLFAIFIIRELRKMFITVIKEDCFVESNVIGLRKMGKCSFLIAVISIIRLFFALTPATLIIILVFTIAGLFSLVLSQVFEEAIRYKDENDLTI